MAFNRSTRVRTWPELLLEELEEWTARAISCTADARALYCFSRLRKADGWLNSSIATGRADFENSHHLNPLTPFVG